MSLDSISKWLIGRTERLWKPSERSFLELSLQVSYKAWNRSYNIGWVSLIGLHKYLQHPRDSWSKICRMMSRPDKMSLVMPLVVHNGKSIERRPIGEKCRMMRFDVS